ncbi:MAG: hypothetical protein JST00_02635 [Deltaproteobacteria bacterium]|nr:hypothetical protein [Deltaproteobacteria bacterium]
MLRSRPMGDLVLRILDGRSDRTEVVLRAGTPLPPFAVGSSSPWKVTAPHVQGMHVMIAFNGASLFVCALPGSAASLGGAPLDARWVEVRVPTELRFGGARIFVDRSSAGAPAAAASHPTKRDDDVTVVGNAQEVDLHPALTEAVTRIADVEVPDEARGPSSQEITTPPSPALPMPRPPSRPIRLVRKAPASSRTAPIDIVPPRLLARIAPAPRATEVTETSDHALTSEDAPHSPAGALTEQLLRGLRSSPPSPRKKTIPTSGLGGPASRTGAPPAPPPARPPAPPAAPAAAAAPLVAVGPASTTVTLPLVEGRPPQEEGTRNRPRLDSLVPCVGAVDGGVAELADARASQASAVTRRLRDLQRGWDAATLARKASLVLVLPALVGALTSLGAASASSHVRAPVAPKAAPASPMIPSGVPKPVDPVPEAVPVPLPAPVSTPARTTPKPAVHALRDTRTEERRAVDAAAAGADAEAAERYEALAAAHPDNVAFREAARILRSRASARPE